MHISNFICQNILVSHLWGSNRRYAQLVSGLDSQRRGLGLDTLLLSRAYHFVLTDVCSVVSRTDQERKIDSSWFTSQVALNAFFLFLLASVSLPEMLLCMENELVISYASSNETELKWISFARLQPIHIAVEYKGGKKTRKNNTVT